MKNLGYNNAESYIRDIASNFDEIYQSSRENTRFILVKRNKINGFMPIDLELAFDGENYHSIISAIPMKDTKIDKQIKKEVLIYSSRPNSAPVSNNGTVPRVNDNSVGVDTPWAASDKLNTSIDPNI